MSSAGEATSHKSIGFYLAFLSISICAFTVALETTVFPIVLLTIKQNLGASTVQYFWASSTFLLLCVLSQPLVTSLSNIFGRAFLLYGCISLFAVGAAIVGAAPNIMILILGRVIQGIGGGGVDVLQEIIVTDMSNLNERALYVGLLNIPIALGSVLGPVIGGAFATYISWRWVGWINLPILAVAMTLGLLFLRLKPIEMSSKMKWGRIDWIGMGLFIVGLTGIIIPLSWAGVLYPWRAWQTYTPLILGGAILALFAIYEHRMADPMLPPRLFSASTAVCCMVGSLIHGLVTYGVLNILPLYFQGVQGESPIQSAVSIFPLSFVVMPSGIFAALSVPLFRRYHWIMWLGWVCISVGIGIMSLLDVDSSKAYQNGLQIVAGVGVGILFTIIALPLQANVDKNDVGLAVGTLVFFRLTGEVIGLAVSAAIFSNTYANRIASLGSLPVIAEPFIDSTTAVYAISMLSSLDSDPETKRKILETYVASLRAVLISMAALCPIGFFTSLFIQCEALDRDETGQQGFVEGG